MCSNELPVSLNLFESGFPLYFGCRPPDGCSKVLGVAAEDGEMNVEEN